MSAVRTCSTCKYWDETSRIGGRDFSSMRVCMQTNREAWLSYGTMAYGPNEHGPQDIVTGPHFGCVHHDVRRDPTADAAESPR